MNNNTNFDTKQCVRCKEISPRTKEFFESEKRNKDGLTGSCKKCRKVTYQIYKSENKEKVIERNAKYYEKTKEKQREKAKKYRQHNKESVRISNRRYYAENIGKVREQTRIRVQRRNAIKSTLQSNLTLEQWAEVKEHFHNKCAYCGKERTLEQEHFIPISKGGEYTINNIIPSCRSCNASKFNHSFFDWYPNYKYYSVQRENNILKYLEYNNNQTQQLALL